MPITQHISPSLTSLVCYVGSLDMWPEPRPVRAGRLSWRRNHMESLERHSLIRLYCMERGLILEEMVQLAGFTSLTVERFNLYSTHVTR